MNQRKKARQLIETLERGRVFCECPSCGDTLRLADAGLFYLDDFTPEAEELYREKLQEIAERRRELRQQRRRIPQRSERGATAVNIGFILERLAPAMKSFAFDRNDCRSLFDPIDYVIFDGLSRRGAVERIVFTDIKTGNARLADRQREIRALVERGRVEFDTYDPGVAP
ncbi:MAG TPA: Holliday junction resolvase-like protein [Gemmatimonadaceae bacterium]|nr:Holliday junction resolvase-like protein [Gemmatimonadaceae bacterium]